MSSPAVRLTLLVLGLLAPGFLLAPAARAQERGQEEGARRAGHLLDYIAVDYPAAVSGGQVVRELEYREQREFVGEVDAQLARLGLPEDDELRGGLRELREAILARDPAAAVSSRASELGAAIRRRFSVRALPPRTPDLAHGEHVYADQCSSCHGATGRGDGPAGIGLDPLPADFTDRARARQLSPLTLYDTISFGIAGTAMVGFADSLEEATRHDLAFYVGSLSFAQASVERGRQLAMATPERVAQRVPDLATLAEASADQLSPDAETRDIVAFLRTHPDFLSWGPTRLASARRALDESWAAFERGERRNAVDEAVAAYIEGFEPHELALDALDAKLRGTIELEFIRYRSLLRSGAPRDEVEPVYASLSGNLVAAERRLASSGLGRSPVFLAALTILTREGLEALLIVIALCAILIRAERREGLRYIHLGWLSALAAGAATWLATRELIRVTGAGREVIEGVSSLLAAFILFYVSYWLVSKLEAARWQAFLHDRVTRALARGSLWTLGVVSFVAVYRELLETLLFYQALLAQAGPGGARPLLLGVGAGAGILALVALVLFRFGRRLPLGAFFGASSALLYALAIVLVGQGVAALQEANCLPATLVANLRVEWLGIHGTLEGLAAQSALLLAALATIPRLLGERRRARMAAVAPAPPAAPAAPSAPRAPRAR